MVLEVPVRTSATTALGGSSSRRLRVPIPVFDLGEGLFDRVEVGRVWRQVPEPGGSSLDHLPDSSRLLTSEIVENDDVAFAQGRKGRCFT